MQNFAAFLQPFRGSSVLVFLACLVGGFVNAAEKDTLPVIENAQAPDSFEAMWRGVDPRAEPLETEVLKEWEEDDVTLRVVRFRIGVFKGTTARLAGVYGFPKNAKQKIPGLLQIHGGGQYADYKACLTNAKRGYATLSIAWAGRISAPEYRVGPQEVKLFWQQKTDDPAYKVTTDWGAVDGYHAPGRNAGNQFPSADAKPWTLDAIESPRNSGWFLCALAARRALTFLEEQPEVDAHRLGVYGHSMGGKLTVLTASDSRVKAAAPSCGGISDRDNRSEIFRNTIGDDVNLQEIHCPIIFLSPANDFHGRISDLPRAIREIQSQDWRVTCSPHHNHQDTPRYEVATQLWFDQYLKQKFVWPSTPDTKLELAKSKSGSVFHVEPDSSHPVVAVDVYFTQQGKAKETRFDRLNTMHRFWHHVPTHQTGKSWTAKLPQLVADKPLWIYANITYKLESPVEGAGYYYGVYRADEFNLSSLLTKVPAKELQAVGLQGTPTPKTLIEDFQGDWQKEWFSYRPNEWGRSTNKLYDDLYQAPPNAKLSLEVQADSPNKFVIQIDQYAKEVRLTGGKDWQQITLSPSDFHNFDGEYFPNWENVQQLTLTAATRLRGRSPASKVVGGNWKGNPPQFRNLRWVTGPSNSLNE